MEAVQAHCRVLEEQNRKSLENMRSEMQQEKSKALAMQQKVVDLKSVRRLINMTSLLYTFKYIMALYI